MNLQELTRKYVEIDVKAMEDVLNFIRRRQKAEKLMDDDFDYSMLYEYILKEQEYVRIKDKEKAIEKSKKLALKKQVERTNVLEWLEDNARIDNIPIHDVYMDYVFWAKLKGYSEVSNVIFSKEMVREGYKSNPVYQDGKTVRVYLKED